MLRDNGQTDRPAEYIDGCDSTTRRELHTASAIDPAVTRERGYETITRPTTADDQPRQRLKALRIPTWATAENSYFPGILIPLWSATGAKISYQWKPRNPVPNRDGKKMKYASQQGRASVLDVHPRWTTLGDNLIPPIRDVTRPLWITEGVKKADSLTSRGCITVALGGVYNWRSNLGTLGDWEDIPLNGRTVYVAFDADATTNPMVLRAMTRLGRWLKSKGVTQTLYVIPPATHNGAATKGVDDYFAAGGTLDELTDRATTTPPRAPSQEDPFTDSALAELVAHDALAEHFLHVTNLGWYAYNGRTWRPVADGAATETIREYFRDRYRAALAEEAEAVRRGEPISGGDVDEWRRVQSAKIIAAVLSLARNIDGVTADIGDFDAHHDLLNTPDGALDLRTFEIIPHDPSLKFTKITAVSYHPGAESNDLKNALQAVPDDATDWLQLRLGQSVTGYEPDDDRLLLFQGGGSNGKTVLLGAVRAALGDYAAAIPNTLLLTGKNTGGATPEKMTLQGVRMGYMEETAEGRHLDVQALKEVVGNRTITARKLYKDFVQFGTTHTLFLNTNPLPEVRDTDNGTWRRLLRVPFPYTFVGPHDPLATDNHRRGDPGIKRRMVERPTRENQEAVLAWLVVGANAWYQQDQNLAAEPVPASVQAATAEWRAHADPIIRFMIEHTTGKVTSWIEASELVTVLRAWMLENGMQPGATNTLASRVKGHSALPHGAVVGRIRTANYGAPSRYVGGGTGRTPAQTNALLGVEWLPMDERP